jgi:hypothetical protein
MDSLLIPMKTKYDIELYMVLIVQEENSKNFLFERVNYAIEFRLELNNFIKI